MGMKREKKRISIKLFYFSFLSLLSHYAIRRNINNDMCLDKLFVLTVKFSLFQTNK
jgi:hypothetical protein